MEQAKNGPAPTPAAAASDTDELLRSLGM